MVLSRRSLAHVSHNEDAITPLAKGILDGIVSERIVGPKSIDDEAILIFARPEKQVGSPEAVGAGKAVHGSG